MNPSRSFDEGRLSMSACCQKEDPGAHEKQHSHRSVFSSPVWLRTSFGGPISTIRIFPHPPTSKLGARWMKLGFIYSIECDRWL